MMEMLGVNKNPATLMKLRRQQKRNEDVLKNKKKKKKQEKEDIKVTYISSPMKVKTCASNFRALVQELTGQDSKVADKFLNQQESVSEDHDDGNDEAIAMATAASVDNKNGDDYVYQHVVEDQGLYLPKLEDSSSWLDLLREDYCSEFQYSRSSFEPLNQQLVHQV